MAAPVSYCHSMLQTRKIKQIAQKHNWERDFEDWPNATLGFKKGTGNDLVLLRVHFKEHLVSTLLVHPIWGKNKLYRRQVSTFMLERIFENPRLHSSRGFRKVPLRCKKCDRGKCWCSAGEPHFLCEHDLYAHTKAALGIPRKKQPARFVKLRVSPSFSPAASRTTSSGVP